MTYSLVWQPFAEQSPTGRPLQSPVAFPFFADGREHTDLTAGTEVRLDARGLLLGILIGYESPSPFIDCAEHSQLNETALDVVSALRAPTLEAAVLDAAAYLRERHDLVTSHAALMTATKLAPHSALVRADFIATSWSLLKESTAERQFALLQQIATAFREPDLTIIAAEAIPQTLYAALVAYHLLPKRERERDALLANAKLRSITDDWYVDRIRYLLSEPRPRIETLL